MRNDLPSHKNHTGTVCGWPARPPVASQMISSFSRRLLTALPTAVLTSSSGLLRVAMSFGSVHDAKPRPLRVCRPPYRGRVKKHCKEMKKVEAVKKTEAEWK